LIAISLAMVPAYVGAAISTKPVEMSMSDQTDMPCCPPPDDGKGSIACAAVNRIRDVTMAHLLTS
jgi:hypothetical protein